MPLRSPQLLGSSHGYYRPYSSPVLPPLLFLLDLVVFALIHIVQCVVRVTRGDPDDEPLFAPDDNELSGKVDTAHYNMIVVCLGQLLPVWSTPMYCTAARSTSSEVTRVTLLRVAWTTRRCYDTSTTTCSDIVPTSYPSPRMHS